MEQILDQGDDDSLNRPHDEGGEQNGQAAQVKLEEGRERREGEFKEHHHSGNGSHQGSVGEHPGALIGIDVRVYGQIGHK